MDTIKTSALTLVAMVASLTLLLTPDTDKHDVDVKTPVPSLQSPAAPIKYQEFQQSELSLSRLVKPRQSTTAVEKPSPNQDYNSPLILYPELEQIIQLENLPPEMAFDQLQPFLYDANPVIRLAAIESLADMSHPARLPTLTAALIDPNPQIRIAALEALGSQESPSAVISVEPYLFDPERDVRVAAIEALASLEYVQAVHSLGGLLSDQDVQIRHHTVNALGNIGGDNAVLYLLQARYDPDEIIGANAEAILFELGYKADY